MLVKEILQVLVCQVDQQLFEAISAAISASILTGEVLKSGHIQNADRVFVVPTGHGKQGRDTSIDAM